MKKITHLCLIPTFIILFTFCSEPKKKNQANIERVEKEAIIAPTTTEKEAFSFQKSQLPILKEQLFFFLRENAVKIDRNSFVKYENIQVSNSNFEYTVVIADKDMLALNRQSNKVNQLQVASIFAYDGEEDEEIGDTITIKGTLTVTKTQKDNNEGNATKVTIALEATVESSYLQAPAYGYGEYERILEDTYDYQEELIVDLQRPYIYNKSEMYLKARIAELTANDLSSYNTDELAYLRNEIFARHGHSFKTEKMQAYFDSKMWYVAVFEDATPFLNEIEKKNALFIRSMES